MFSHVAAHNVRNYAQILSEVGSHLRNVCARPLPHSANCPAHRNAGVAAVLCSEYICVKCSCAFRDPICKPLLRIAYANILSFSCKQIGMLIMVDRFCSPTPTHHPFGAPTYAERKRMCKRQRVLFALDLTINNSDDEYSAKCI